MQKYDSSRGATLTSSSSSTRAPSPHALAARAAAQIRPAQNLPYDAPSVLPSRSASPSLRGALELHDNVQEVQWREGWTDWQADNQHNQKKLMQAPQRPSPSDVEAAIRAAVQQAQRMAGTGAGVSGSSTSQNHDAGVMERSSPQGSFNAVDDGVRSDYECLNTDSRVEKEQGTLKESAQAQAPTGSWHADTGTGITHEQRVLGTHRNLRGLEVASFDDLRKQPEWSVYAQPAEQGPGITVPTSEALAASSLTSAMKSTGNSLQALLERKQVSCSTRFLTVKSIALSRIQRNCLACLLLRN
jgi:hypothetical protein